MLNKLKMNNKFNEIVRNFSFQAPNPLPVIKIPKYLKLNLSKIRYKEEKKAKQIDKNINNDKNLVQKSGDKSVLIISGKNTKYNHYFGQIYRNKDEIPLISKQWISATTNGMFWCFV